MKSNPSMCCKIPACDCSLNDRISIRIEFVNIYAIDPPASPTPAVVHVDIPLVYVVHEGYWHADNLSDGWPFDPVVNGGDIMFRMDCYYAISLNAVLEYEGAEYFVGWPDEARPGHTIEKLCNPFLFVSMATAAAFMYDIANGISMSGEIKVIVAS